MKYTYVSTEKIIMDKECSCLDGIGSIHWVTLANLLSGLFTLYQMSSVSFCLTGQSLLLSNRPYIFSCLEIESRYLIRSSTI